MCVVCYQIFVTAPSQNGRVIVVVVVVMMNNYKHKDFLFLNFFGDETGGKGLGLHNNLFIVMKPVPYLFLYMLSNLLVKFFTN